MSDHIKTRKMILEVGSMDDFETLLSRPILSPIEREIMYLHYKDGKDFRYIGDILGYSESTIKRKHKKILDKIKKSFE